MVYSNLMTLLRIKVENRELKDVDHFKYFGSVLIRGDSCTREIKMKIYLAKEFNRKISFLAIKLNIELRKKLVTHYVWSILLYDLET